MAIDTENKRRSVQSYWIGAARPVPDGTIAASDRAASGWHYSGLTYDSPVAITFLVEQFQRLWNIHSQIHHFN